MIDIKRLINESNLKAGDRVADFGAGSGFVAIELARAAGEKGELVAIDILEEALEVIESKARQLGLLNIKTVRSNLENKNGSTLEPNSMDLIVMINILFQIENPESIIKEAQRILKIGGKIVVVEWQPGKMPGQTGHFLRQPPEIKKDFEQRNFSLVKEFSPGPNHYGLIYQK